MQYLEDMKKATVAEFDAAEADWRETVERQYEYLSECEDTPTPEMLDGEDLDDAIGIIDNYLQSVQERANDWEIDAEEWGQGCQGSHRGARQGGQAQGQGEEEGRISTGKGENSRSRKRGRLFHCLREIFPYPSQRPFLGRFRT